MKNRKVLISGAGIAGPALAHCLAGAGYEPVVVERAPALREGGQAVDFRGPVHREVLERLGLWEPIHARRTVGNELVMVNRRGQPIATLPGVMMSGDVEILRGDLSRLLYELTAAHTPYRFGDWAVELEQRGAEVCVRFASGTTESFGLVVGADGLHSGIRALAFGDESLLLRHHGYRLATYSLPNVTGLRPGRALAYAEPGRSMMVSPEPGGSRCRAQFVFAGPPMNAEARRDPAQLQREVVEAYRGAGWEVSRILAELPNAPDAYFDQIGSVHLDRYSHGRVVLLGDAAYGGTLGGQGTSLAVVGAHVLANELKVSNGDPATAFARFEALLRPYATECQKGAKNVGSFFAPKTQLGLAARNLIYRALTSRLLIAQFEKLVKASASSFELPAYGAGQASP